MKKTICCTLFLLAAISIKANEILIAGSNGCNWQIVMPDQMPHPILATTLSNAAGIMQDMFKANGWTNVALVKEAQAEKEKPGIYLGDTAAARSAGLDTQKMPVWTYAWKIKGQNIIIAGRDWAAAKKQDHRGETPCSHGTVKGLADFMREYCGTRFLTPVGMPGIEFLPVTNIVVPGNLELRKEPMVASNCGGRPTTDITSIALNFFDNVTTEYFAHTHELVIRPDLYAEKHPEYFALVNGQRMAKGPHLCYSNKEVQDLIYQDILRSCDAGYPAFASMQADGFTPCQCEDCKKMFDTGDWGEKLWLLNKKWADRLLKDRPGKAIIVGAYTVTEKPPQSFKKFPDSLMVSTRSTEEALRQWDEWKVPGGFTAYLHAWGGYHLGGYTPVRTPLFSEKTVKLYEKYNIKGVGLDSPPATMWMLEGPAVYVYCRMFDNVKTNSALKLTEEYIQAAFGKAAPAMTRFYDELHHTLEAYSEVFGVDNGTFQGYKRASGRWGRYLTSGTKLRLIAFIYPPETLNLLESQLAQAEKTAGLNEKNKLRLALARREFDYLKSTARVVHMYNAYLTRQDKATFDQLLNEMEKREKMILQWYDTSKDYFPEKYGKGLYLQKPISTNWAKYIGSQGHYNTHLIQNGGTYLGHPVPPFTWKIAEMRKAPLFEPKKLAVKKTSAPLSIGPEQWQDIPAVKLGPLSLGAEAPKQETEFKIAYDSTSLYVRFEGKLPEGWICPREKPDSAAIVNRESFSIVAAPDGNPDRYYRFAGGPTNSARYDARHGFIEDSIDPRFDQDDIAWNTEWKYECAVAADGKSWSALFVIPFQAPGVSAPVAGTEWKVNFGRLHQVRPGYPAEESLWSSNPDTTAIGDRKAFGALLFE